jgi:hypothetical protein
MPASSGHWHLVAHDDVGLAAVACCGTSDDEPPLVSVAVTYSSEQARREILDVLASAADATGRALAELSEAYEHLDERTAERLEETLFGPAQAAYGRAKRTHSSFAERHGLPTHAFQPAGQVAPSSTPAELIQRAVAAADGAEAQLAELQDSMLPVEVGDAELRAGIAEVRELLGRLRPAARELVRTLGR